MKKVADILSTILIVFLIVAIVTVLVLKLAFGAEMKAVVTPSMEPNLPVGSLIVIFPTDYDKINVGDDITFIRDKNLTLLTHRVISKDDTTKKLTTQGIANNTADKPTTYDNVLGKVRFCIPYLGYLIIWTNSTYGKAIAIVVIAVIVILSIVLGKSTPKKQKKKSSEDELAYETPNESEKNSKTSLESPSNGADNN
ncbi:MAG: signal peptidase I [Clostridiales bacterium]|nr:signal peptidase I [Clostridiales bacterium]